MSKDTVGSKQNTHLAEKKNVQPVKMKFVTLHSEVQNSGHFH